MIWDIHTRAALRDDRMRWPTVILGAGALLNVAILVGNWAADQLGTWPLTVVSILIPLVVYVVLIHVTAKKLRQRS